MEIIKKNELSNEQERSNENGKICYICQEKFKHKYDEDERIS